VGAKSLRTARPHGISLQQLQLCTAEMALFSNGEKMAKFGILGKICSFWETKNDNFGGKSFGA